MKNQREKLANVFLTALKIALHLKFKIMYSDATTIYSVVVQRSQYRQ